MANIGNLAVQISANPTGLVAGMAAAGKAMESGGAKIADEAAKTAEATKKGFMARTKAIASIGQGYSAGIAAKIRSGASLVASAAGSVAGWAEKAYKDPVGVIGDASLGMIARVAKAIPVFGDLIALPFEGARAGLSFMLEAYKEGSERIKEMGEAAERTGTTLSEFQLFAMVAGGAQVGEKAVFKFQVALGSAKLAAVGTNDAFTRLGLKGAELADMPIADALARVADKVKGLGNSGLQAKAAFELFGKSGFQIMPALMRGGEFVEKNRGFIDKFGLGFSNADLANIKAIGLAKKQIEYFKTGFTNQITLAVAPILAEVADRLGQIPGGAKGMADAIIAGAESAALAVARLVDTFGDVTRVLELLKIGWQVLQAEIIKGFATIIDELPGLRDGLKSTSEAIAPSNSWKNWLTPMQSAPRLAISTVLGMAIGNEERDSDATRRMRARAQAMSDEANLRLKAFDKVSGENSIAGMVKGAFESIAARRQMPPSNSITDPFKGLYPRVEALANSLTRPINKFIDQTAEVAQLRALTPIDQSMPGLGDRALAHAFLGLRQGYQLPQERFAGVMEMGSREAYSTALAYQSQGRQNVQEEIKALLAEAKRQNDEQIRIGKEVAEALKGQKLELFGF